MHARWDIRARLKKPGCLGWLLVFLVPAFDVLHALVGGEVDVDGGEGGVARFDHADVGVLGVVEQVELAVEPVVVVPPRIEVGGELFNKAGAAHPRGLHALELIQRDVRYVDVEQRTVGQGFLGDLLHYFFGHMRGGFPDRFPVGAEREGDGGDADDHGLAGGGYGAGIEHADAGVGAEVDAADDEVGQLVFVQQAEGKLDAVGGCPAHGHAEMLVVLLDGDGFDRVGERDGVAGGAAFRIGRADMQLAEVADGFVEFRDPARMDAVVVAQ